MASLIPESSSKRYGEFVYTSGKKGSLKTYRVSYKGANIDVIWPPTMTPRDEIVKGLMEGRAFRDVLRENYPIESEEDIDSFLKQQPEYRKLDAVLEDGVLPEEDRESLEELFEEEIPIIY